MENGRRREESGRRREEVNKVREGEWGGWEDGEGRGEGYVIINITHLPLTVPPLLLLR